MKSYIILMSGVLLLLAVRCGEKEEVDQKTNSQETPEHSQETKQKPTRGVALTATEQSQKKTAKKAALSEISHTELEQRDPGNGRWRAKGEDDPFTGLGVGIPQDGSKSLEMSYLNDLGHGAAIHHNKDGSKKSERHFENGIFKGRKSF